jgi:V8-like Glu-specific endopeptidase
MMLKIKAIGYSGLLLALLSSAGYAQKLPPLPASMPAAQAARITPPTDAQRMLAKPMLLLPRSGPGGPTSAPSSMPLMGEPAIHSGAQRGSGAASSGPHPVVSSGPSIQNYGSSGVSSIWHYNDRLVDPYATYPYRTYGKIYFQQSSGGGFFTCSGALISRSIVVTAGHCVHRGNGNNQRGIGYNATTFFYPAINEQPSPDYIPYGYAQEVSIFTTNGWYNNGSQNSTLGKGWDVGIITLGKRRLADGTSTTTELGAVAGWNNFCYQNCLQDYWGLSQYGYPGNYYFAQRMTESQHLASIGSRWASFASGDYVAGSGMEGGSSGGPSVSNPGSISDSAANQGAYPFRNIIFAVTSWGYPNASLKVQGYSSLSGPSNVNNFKGMYNTMCNIARQQHGTGSCGLLP